MFTSVQSCKVPIAIVVKSKSSIWANNRAFVRSSFQVANDVLHGLGMALLWGIAETANLRYSHGNVGSRIACLIEKHSHD